MHMPDHRRYPAFAASRLPHVGTYRRVLPVSLERLVRKRTRLGASAAPASRRASRRSNCEEAGPWGWRAATTSPRGQRLVLELRLDRDCRRWITRTLEGANAGSEIWTHAFAVSARRTDIVVDFFVPECRCDRARTRRQSRSCDDVSNDCYDEDVAMMVRAATATGRTHRKRTRGEATCVSVPSTRTNVSVAGRTGRARVRRHAGRRRTGRACRALSASTRAARCRGRRHGAVSVARLPVRRQSGECLTGQACRLPRGTEGQRSRRTDLARTLRQKKGCEVRGGNLSQP